MQYVPQEEPGGCLVAAVAMVTGRPYRLIRELCEASYKDGIHWIIAADILADLGYATMTRYKHRPRLKLDRDEWPVLPFAPAHIVILDATQGPHAVAMDETGRVFDPWKAERTTLTHPDYSSISHIEGIWKVR